MYFNPCKVYECSYINLKKTWHVDFDTGRSENKPKNETRTFGRQVCRCVVKNENLCSWVRVNPFTS